MPSLSQAIDIVLQRSVIDLFASHGVVVAPVSVSEIGQRKPFCHDFVAVVHFTNPRLRGSIAFSAPTTTLTGMKHGPRAAGAVSDWARELVNQLSGRVKNKLIRYQINLDVSLPSVFDRRIFETKRSSATPFLTDPGLAFLEKSHAKVPAKAKFSRRNTLYEFRTVGAELVVTLHADYCDEGLVVANHGTGVEEGEIILFD